MVLCLIASLGSLAAAPSIRTALERLDTMAAADLAEVLPNLAGGELAVGDVLLAAQDPNKPDRVEAAYVFLDSVDRSGGGTPIGLAVLGMAEALKARSRFGDPTESTRWMMSSVARFDGAVASDSTDPWIRILRARYLAQAPKIFQLDGRIRDDSLALRRMLPRLEAMRPAALLALAAACERLGNREEAASLRLQVENEPRSAATQREKARERLVEVGDRGMGALR
jgi:hypothetical protein